MQVTPPSPAAAPAGAAAPDNRRDELADSALVTLGERGYAHTSLRDIAANSPFSHGVIHYYFKDKSELITYCVRRYKTKCARRYDPVVETSTTADELVQGFADRLCETLQVDAAMHRLWYDIRTQAMFEPVLQDEVLAIDATLEDMIWRVLTRYAELSGKALIVDSPTGYAMLDGIFEAALLRHLCGQPDAKDTLHATTRTMLPHLLT